MFKRKPETHTHTHVHASQAGTLVSTRVTLWLQVCSSCLSYFNLTLLSVKRGVYFSVYNYKPFFTHTNIYMVSFPVMEQKNILTVQTMSLS